MALKSLHGSRTPTETGTSLDIFQRETPLAKTRTEVKVINPPNKPNHIRNGKINKRVNAVFINVTFKIKRV